MKGSWGTRLADRFRVGRTGARARRAASKVGGSAPPANRAATALKRAERWAAEIAGGATRADIARREGITRARVTQLMKLLDLPAAVRGRLAADGPNTVGWSIRRALREVAEETT